MSTKVFKYTVLAIALAATFSLPTQAHSNGISDAWIDGKLEATYFFNPHLSSFDIKTQVEAGVVRLSGMVESDTERELAEQIARGLDGVNKVINELKVVEPGKAGRHDHNHFGTHVKDATLVFAVKSKLLASDSVKGMKIDVDADHGVITLNGTVETKAQRALAEKLARNTDDVIEVKNLLRIQS